MQDLLFYVFAAVALIAGFLAVANPFSRNPLASALFLAVALVAVSGLFVLLHAFFLGAVQILIYAGAVMVLFLFVIMLLDLREEQKRRARKVAAGLASALALALAALISAAALAGGGPADPPALEGGARALGRALFTDFLLPFEIVAVLLVAAMVGVVWLSRKEAA
ncbi:MAG TPA: NADH-quinone oxidoreductase subunit J [Candidatus Paceibacterota bacterium]|nr:NADH-quinone oxidoreductase subunit J [Verrucomicrobiota bacterium]HOX01634.1 NADH-quinone oxidoreductase subunit J [Verrucomicrobiota bacterium]HRZ43932.1 NADH-quinone oxidoreductase subunit J [Candidatus Paceibacterota bacterium]HRZ93348.1 NADH-quinone oxidoreductase subunit J [Candidatus Paceibacterota bacterium]